MIIDKNKNLKLFIFFFIILIIFFYFLINKFQKKTDISTNPISINLLTSVHPDSTGGPVYKMHFINLDRQKDDSLEIRITDLRND